MLKMPDEVIELAEADKSDFYDYLLARLPEEHQEIYLNSKQEMKNGTDSKAKK